MIDFIFSQVGGRCSIYSLASVVLKFSSRVLSDGTLNELFLRSGGKEDTKARDGASSLPKCLSTLKKEGFISDYKSAFVNLTRFKKAPVVEAKLNSAKDEMEKLVSSKDRGYVVGIFLGAGGLKLDENHVMIPGGWSGYHAVFVKDVKIIKGRKAWRCKNSWGEAFGDKGYFYIYLDDTFNVIREAYYAIR